MTSKNQLPKDVTVIPSLHGVPPDLSGGQTIPAIKAKTIVYFLSPLSSSDRFRFIPREQNQGSVLCIDRETGAIVFSLSRPVFNKLKLHREHCSKQEGKDAITIMYMSLRIEEERFFVDVVSFIIPKGGGHGL